MRLQRNEILTGLLVLATIAVLTAILILLGAPGLFRPLTRGASGFRAVGPGRRGKEWRGGDGDHFVFEQSDPVQTYLFSFGVARLAVAVDGMFSIYAQRTDASKTAFAKTADAYAFLRTAASIAPPWASLPSALEPRSITSFMWVTTAVLEIMW